MEGQLWPLERKFLSDAIKLYRPSIVLEIGTWKGGGSTLQIAEIISTYGGTLYTCETDTNLYHQAVASYADSKLKKNIVFYNIPSTAVIEQLIYKERIPDFVFFDGPENPDINFNDFLLLEPYLRLKSVFCCHDWDRGCRPDGVVSLKTVILRPYLECSNNWKLKKSLSAPDSVGIALFEKIK